MPDFGMQQRRPWDFDTVPKIRRRIDSDTHDFSTLMPEYGGLPGCTYLQIPAIYEREATMDAEVKHDTGHEMAPGWARVDGIPPYTICGPEGMVDCVFMVSGSRIEGELSGSTEQECFIDQRIYEETGIPNPGPYEPRRFVPVEDVKGAPAGGTPSPSNAGALASLQKTIDAQATEMDELKQMIRSLAANQMAEAAPKQAPRKKAGKRRGRPPGSKNKAKTGGYREIQSKGDLEE